jgi:hypothetical protein
MVWDLITEIVNAYISSSEETMFGDWLEGLAIFINQKVYSGWKSGIKGIDLEFDKDGTRYIVSIKSGPNWGNSSQIEKMINNFNTSKKTLRTSNSHLNIVCVNGCCYGKDSSHDKGSYYKYCGQIFGEFIGGSEDIYTDIIEPLGYKAGECNDDYMAKYHQMVNKFTKEFIESFYDNTGAIDWDKLVKFNSGKRCKMAVALDNAFFKTLPELPETAKADADIAWFIRQFWFNTLPDLWASACRGSSG